MVGINRYFKKVTKGLPPLLRAISRFCGFPIGLMTLPMVMAKAKVSNNGFAGRQCFLARSRTIGVPIMAIVSFIKNADAIPPPNKMNNKRCSADFAFLNSLYE